MKLRILLWALGWLMKRASRREARFREQLAGKSLSFQLGTLDGAVSRHYVIRDQSVSSHAGATVDPAFSVLFNDAAYGYATLTSSDRQRAFMQGIQDRRIQVAGNPALLLWFQGLVGEMKAVQRLG